MGYVAWLRWMIYSEARVEGPSVRCINSPIVLTHTEHWYWPNGPKGGHRRERERERERRDTDGGGRQTNV